MGISYLQQQGLISSPDFQGQVASIVATEALYKNDTMPDLTPNDRDVLKRVVQNPDQFAFAETIVKDSGWSLTYDPWAAAPPTHDDAIRAGVNKYFVLLTGFNPLPTEEPEVP